MDELAELASSLFRRSSGAVAAPRLDVPPDRLARLVVGELRDRLGTGAGLIRPVEDSSHSYC